MLKLKICPSCKQHMDVKQFARCVVRGCKSICAVCQMWCEDCDETRCLEHATTATTACKCAAQRYWEHSKSCASYGMNFGAALTPQEFLDMEKRIEQIEKEQQ